MAIKITNLGNRILNQYILESDKGIIIIDTGYPGGFIRFRDKFESYGFKAEDIRFIILTHVHDDHAGFLNELLDYCDAPLILHNKAVERLTIGQNIFEGGCPTYLAYVFCVIMKLIGKGKHLFPSVARTERYIILQDNLEILKDHGFPVDIITLPGHTADSIGLVFDGKVFCGDAAMNGFSSIANHPILVENTDEFIQSWDKIINTNADTVYPSHGRPFSIKNIIKHKNYMTGKKLIN